MKETMYAEVWYDVDIWSSRDYKNMRLLKEKPKGKLEKGHTIHEI